jgi:general secretion pathway protein E
MSTSASSTLPAPLDTAAPARPESAEPGRPLTGLDVREAIKASDPPDRLAWLAQSLGWAIEDFTPEAARHFHIRHVPIDELRLSKVDFTIVGFPDCQRRRCAVVQFPDEALPTPVLTDPTDAATRAWLQACLERAGYPDAEPALASAADLHAFLTMAEKGLRAMDGVSVEQQSGVPGEARGALSLSISDIDASESPVVRLVDSTLFDALRSGASDIHLETHPQGMVIKYRIDGVLELVKRVNSLDIAHQAISRIKVVSELDISERRIPQDGRFKVFSEGREIDFRVSIMPNLVGEDAVLRVLDRKHLTGQFRALTLDTLTFDQSVIDFVRRISRQPYGLLLVTGPTGSGKTTTLYAALSEINTGLDKIVTIEDPIEYQLPDVLQIPVNEKKGLTFAVGLRSILRHDPDKIMVGEIRDGETAQIAVQAALTGHQVFTTVHANNVFDVIGRFANMGVDSYSLVAALNGIVAQRLLRLTCRQCSAPDVPDPDLLSASGLKPAPGQLTHYRRGLGCAACRGSGYRGRRAIAETLTIDDELRDMLLQRASVSQIKAAARASGFFSLRDAAIALVYAGETTLDEINRVTPVE